MKKFEIVSFVYDEKSTVIQWTDVHGLFTVYENDVVCYQGPCCSFQKTNGHSKGVIHYSIEQSMAGKLVDVIRLQVVPFFQGGQEISPMQKIDLLTIVHRHKIVLQWGKIEGVNRYKVYKNNRFLKETTNLSIVDQDVDDKQANRYKIIAERPVEKSDERLNVSKGILARLMKWAFVRKGNPAIEQFEMIKEVFPLNNLLLPHREKHDKTRMISIRYTTFLREQFIRNPNVFSRYDKFLGDARSFDPNALRYRTRVDIAFHLAENQIFFSSTKKIGETVAFNRNEEMVKKATANDDKIDIRVVPHKNNRITFSVVHHVNNPLTFAPAIHYELFGTVYKCGRVEVAGFHNQAPHHEVYMNNHCHGWRALHLSESKGVVWLSNLTSRKHWRYSSMI